LANEQSNSDHRAPNPKHFLIGPSRDRNENDDQRKAKIDNPSHITGESTRPARKIQLKPDLTKQRDDDRNPSYEQSQSSE
jgi:hypothetical protein